MRERPTALRLRTCDTSGKKGRGDSGEGIWQCDLLQWQTVTRKEKEDREMGRHSAYQIISISHRKKEKKGKKKKELRKKRSGNHKHSLFFFLTPLALAPLNTTFPLAMSCSGNLPDMAIDIIRFALLASLRTSSIILETFSLCIRNAAAAFLRSSVRVCL